MSHFVVLVTGENIEEQLDPYYEGKKVAPYPDDHYTLEKIVADIEKYVIGSKDYPSQKMFKSIVKDFKNMDQDEFLKFHRSWLNKSFMERWCGKLIEKDGMVYTTYNPNSKWDWWQIGGRWTGELKLKLVENPDYSKVNLNNYRLEDVQKIIEHMQVGPQPKPEKGKSFISTEDYEKADKIFTEKLKNLFNKMAAHRAATYPKIYRPDDFSMTRETVQSVIEVMYPPHKNGSPGVFGGYANLGWTDQTLKKHVDIDGMEKPLKVAAEKRWKKFDRQIKPHLNVLENKPFDEQSKESQKLRKKIEPILGFMYSEQDFKNISEMACEEYVACSGNWSPYAFVWDGKWYSRGDMGWWGISSNEESSWKGQFKELWNDISDDELLTIVDCHI